MTARAHGAWSQAPQSVCGKPHLPCCSSYRRDTFVFTLTVQRPVIHPLSSPSNSFCVTSLDPDTLPAVATLLMDVMFYSNG